MSLWVFAHTTNVIVNFDLIVNIREIGGLWRTIL